MVAINISGGIIPIPLPGDLLAGNAGDHWLAATTRTLGRLHAGFLIAEDPQLRLDARQAATLMHQVSLVEHILMDPNLRKVLIGDEVGLGKTIEAGLLIQALAEKNSLLRILYLAPARLVGNVHKELSGRLGIKNVRLWVAGNLSTATLEEDKIVIASIHKATHGKNLDTVCASGPWDVVIVDECHHLSDWGNKPTRSFMLVDRLTELLLPGDRLILMSGTPHQGNQTRFENLLRLLSDVIENPNIKGAAGKDIAGAAGRVIYRTKDNIRDWQGNPLFPVRDVRSPELVDLGKPYRDWCIAIGALYTPPVGGTVARNRAAGWAKGMALQWAASSVRAGLGFLVRLAIRRLGWRLNINKADLLDDALKQLRPYRNGAEDEPLQDLYQRIVKQIADNKEEPVNGDEDKVDAAQWAPDPKALADLIQQGINLIAGGADLAKWETVCKLIDAPDAQGEKIVFFAQPVETVTIFAAFLKARYPKHGEPSIIIGDQTDAKRRKEVDRFQVEGGPRFLVSSRAGSEGLNLQCASRLVHLDVPWNPMELEQRIGRIHRFGSRKIVVIDTVVANGSREVDMYCVARARLQLIVGQLAPDQDFEALFGRVMSLVQPQDLQDILGDIAGERILDDAPVANTIRDLVTKGFTWWQQFDATYSAQAASIRAINPGQAQWADVGNFLGNYHGAVNHNGAMFNAPVYQNGQIGNVPQSVPTISFKGQIYACGDIGGLTAISAASSVAQLGLNLPIVRQALHDSFAPKQVTGAAFVTRPAGLNFLGSPNNNVIVLAFMRQTVKADNNCLGGWAEQAITLHMYVLGAQAGSQPQKLTDLQGAELIRGLQSMSHIRNPTGVPPVRSDLVDIEEKLLLSLQVPSPDDIAQGRMHAVWPIAAIALHP